MLEWVNPDHPGSPDQTPGSGLPPIPEPTRTWVLELPWTSPPLRLNQVMGAAWTKHRQAVEDVQNAVGWLARYRKVPRLRRCRVELIYWPRNNRVQDADGLAATLKPALDGLRAVGVLADDRGRVVVHVGLRVVERADDPDCGRPPRLALVLHEV